MKKRLTALILILTMLWSSGFEVVPELFSAYAAESEERDLKTEEAASVEAEAVPVVYAEPPAPVTAAEPIVSAGNAEHTTTVGNTEQTPPAENVEQNAQAENAEQTASAENAEQNAPAENAEQIGSAENSEQTVPAENAERTSPTENTELTPPVENEEQPVPTENAANLASQEVINEQTDPETTADEEAIASGDNEEQTPVGSAKEEIDQPIPAEQETVPAEDTAGAITSSENDISADEFQHILRQPAVCLCLARCSPVRALEHQADDCKEHDDTKQNDQTDAPFKHHDCRCHDEGVDQPLKHIAQHLGCGIFDIVKLRGNHRCDRAETGAVEIAHRHPLHTFTDRHTAVSRHVKSGFGLEQM